MKNIVTVLISASVLTACSDSDYQQGTNYILISNENIYINRLGSEFKLINNTSGQSVTGKIVANDASSVNAIIEDGYIQIGFEKTAFDIPARISLQRRDSLPYLCNECPEGMKEWSRKKS